MTPERWRSEIALILPKARFFTPPSLYLLMVQTKKLVDHPAFVRRGRRDGDNHARIHFFASVS
jgi:hypothetical protein